MGFVIGPRLSGTELLQTTWECGTQSLKHADVRCGESDAWAAGVQGTKCVALVAPC